ncbi:MAG: gliding motility-associated C-terminal domain-containing protein [Bacteroidales bacterium]|nr:gliding motility-associated C-terminal domain-containing protein [Bacteroidales bacterium]
MKTAHIKPVLALFALLLFLGRSWAQCDYPQSTEMGSPCAFQGILPFCTDLNPYGITYASGTEGNAFGSFFPDTNRVACLSDAPAPAWYYLRISEPGELLFHIEQFDQDSVGIDVDFACWGPFHAETNADFLDNLCCGVYELNTQNNVLSHVVGSTGHHQPPNTYNNRYPYGNLVDCSYATDATEWCYIPNAQEGEYYLLLITNFASNYGRYGTITFSTATNTADSLNAMADCSITEAVASNSPVCEDDTLFLYCNTPSYGVTYLWTGPNGWTDSVANPVIPHVTASMAGLYTLVMTNGIDTTEADSLFVTIHTQPPLLITTTSLPVCPHGSVTLSAAGAEHYHWSNGSDDPTLTITVDSSLYVTVTAYSTYCQRTDSVWVEMFQPLHESETVTECEQYGWHGMTFDTSGTYLYPHTDIHGCDQVDTLHLTIYHHSQSVVHDTIVENQLATWQYQGHHFNGTTDTLIHIPNLEGCDSAVSYHLFVYPNLYVTKDSTLCENDLPLVWNGETFTESDVRTVTLPASTGADSIVTMEVTVHYNTTGTDVQTACESYTWIDGQTYTQTPVTPPVHTIVGGNQWGCDSVVTLQLTVWHAQHESDTVTACESYSWHGTDYTQTGTFLYPHTDLHGCAQTDTLHLTILHDSQSVVHDTIVENQLAMWQYQGHHFNGTTDTLIHIPNLEGCDSAISYHLFVYPNIYVTMSNTLCENDLPLVWNGETFTASDVRTVTLPASTGADSIVTMEVTVHYNTTGTDVQTACESYTWIDGQTYTETPVTPPVHTIADGNQWGCDSVVTLQLTVWHAQHESDTATACESYNWHGTDYTQTGTFLYPHTDLHGCAQTDTLHLTILHDSQSVVHDTIVENQLATWQYQGHHFGGTTDTLIHIPNLEGCDSVVSYHLFVYPNLYVTMDSTLCENDLPLVWNGETFTASDVRTVTLLASTGADSIVTMEVTVHYNTTGTDVRTACESYTWIDGQTYAETPVTPPVHTIAGGNQWGCDSIVTLQLTVWHAQHESDTATECESYSWHGTDYTQTGTFLYPHTDLHGCAQTDTLHLIIRHHSQSAVFDTIVENQLPDWTYQDSYFMGEADSVFHLLNHVGCDSAVNYHLHVYLNQYVTLDSTLCENDLPLVWNGETFTASDVRTVILPASTGADSVITMEVTVLYNSLVHDVRTSCGPFLWLDGNWYAESNQEATYILENAVGCDSIIALQLTVVDTSLHIIASADDYCDELTMTLTVEGDFTNYLWNTGETTTQVEVDHSGTYRVSATREPCEATASFEVPYCELNVYLPNAITPSNADGLNDLFRLDERAKHQISDCSIHIYNRWGELVFHSATKDFEWDGSVQGKLMTDVVYNYVLHYKNREGRPFVKKGSIVVL